MKQSVERIKDDDIDLIMLPLPLFYATYKVNMLFSKGVTHICKMSGQRDHLVLLIAHIPL